MEETGKMLKNGGSFQRDKRADLREEILLETNFDDDGILTKAYANNPLPSNKRRSIFRSDNSLDRYSDHTLHGLPKQGECFQSFITRVPHATVIATLMCLLGGGIFCGTMYRGATLTIIMLDQVFHIRLLWIEAVQMVFVITAATMGALGFLILFVGFLATGATRHKVYRGTKSRVGGRISCAVLIGITYFLNFIWMLILAFLIIVTFIYTMFWNLCSSVEKSRTCIDLTQFHFMFPSNTKQEELKICENYEIKAFCKDSVENAEAMFVLATLSALLVILSLIHYLMCLSANYAHIRDHEKFQELDDLHVLNEIEYSASSKDRF
ncbi:neuronal membrane glycoprotein M6-a isoform X2 [Condylostylus longicornis]|uniref:neuronal membrane glycoprotein M6-a isoform X2 n=1 Tax=Condylostylus longicornis TaxID=2530218 RepID=UPI00244E12D6|nr:neuronal membrane glycoprotein M6-a isoform X2 [Condylostylus longicornis]